MVSRGFVAFVRASRRVAGVSDVDIAEDDLFWPAARLPEGGMDGGFEVEAFRSSSSRCSRMAFAFMRFIS